MPECSDEEANHRSMQRKAAFSGPEHTLMSGQLEGAGHKDREEGVKTDRASAVVTTPVHGEARK